MAGAGFTRQKGAAVVDASETEKGIIDCYKSKREYYS